MKPATIQDVFAAIAPLMRGFAAPWCIAGGWAIDLFLGRETRSHQDLEIAVFRQDQRLLRGHLSDWSFQKVVEGQLVNWPVEEELKLPIHEVHARSARESSLSLEFLLNERSGEEWGYRRDERIRMPLECAILGDRGVLPVLCPAIVLLFKSKNRRPKDEVDFERVRDGLDRRQREWLREALGICDPEHPWVAQLQMTVAEDCPAEPDLQVQGRGPSGHEIRDQREGL